MNKKTVCPKRTNGLVAKHPVTQLVSLRRHYPDQVVKSCPFQDSQIIKTPLTSHLSLKLSFHAVKKFYMRNSLNESWLHENDEGKHS